MSMEVTLPEEKLDQLKSLLTAWKGRKDCTRREVQSLIEHLQHAAKVVRPGRRFIRGMLSLLQGLEKPHHYIRLNTSFRADLHWWQTFISSWNGVSILYRLNRQAPDSEFHTDASGSWGCAALWEGHYFQLPWASCPSFASASIAPKELFPVVIAARYMGPLLVGENDPVPFG